MARYTKRLAYLAPSVQKGAVRTVNLQERGEYHQRHRRDPGRAVRGTRASCVGAFHGQASAPPGPIPSARTRRQVAALLVLLEAASLVVVLPGKVIISIKEV